MRVTVVTASYNAASTLVDTLRSVARQAHADLEHWLIDGASRDATREVVDRYGGHLTGFISESDSGTYDAMNKGASLSKGAVVGFLNADDWYASPEAISRVVKAFEQGADLVYGDLVFVSPDAPFSVRRVWRDAPRSPRRAVMLGWHPAHPATFVTRELFEACGGFDLRWKIGADYAFMVKALGRPGVKIRHVPHVLVNMRLGGASTSGVRAIWRANVECAQALREAGFAWPWLVVLMKVARKIPQLLLSRRRLDLGVVWRPGAP